MLGTNLLRRDHERAVRVPETSPRRWPARTRWVSTPGRRPSAPTTSPSCATRWRTPSNCGTARRVLRRVAHPYDALLDHYEPGFTTAQVRPLLAELREALVPLVGRRRRRRAAT